MGEDARAYEIAERTFEKLFHERHPSPAPPKTAEEKLTPLPGLGAPACTTHKEKTHTFSDGTVWRACTHHECGWGRTTKKHSDGMAGETLYALELPDAVEDDESQQDEGISTDDTQELSVERWAGAEPTFTEDGDELEHALPDLDGVAEEDELCEA